MSATVRFWAAARAAAGLAEEPARGATLAEALAAASEERPALARVLARCSFLVDGEAVGSRDHAEVSLDGVALVDVLPPFAGG